jgi:hypothetical protein
MPPLPIPDARDLLRPAHWVPRGVGFVLYTCRCAPKPHAAPSRESLPVLKKNCTDTNVLLHDPRSLFSFDDNNVVIPAHVIEGSTSSSATRASWDAIPASWLGTQTHSVRRFAGQGVPLPGGGLLRWLHPREIPALGDANLMDNRILAVALDIKGANRRCPPPSSPRTPRSASGPTPSA